MPTPNIPLKLTQNPRGTFLARLQEIRQNLPTGSIAYRLRVPEELQFWYFLEFGTKPHTITPTERQSLHFDGGFFNTIHNPGIRPRLIYRGVRDEVLSVALKNINTAIHASNDGGLDFLSQGFDLDAAVQSSVLFAKEKMADRLETEAPGTRAEGRLKGRSAADIWREEASVEKV